MTKPLTIILLLAGLIINSCTKKAAVDNDSINPIIGDISYIKAYDEAPGDETDDFTRIKTHLQYVEQVLSRRDVSSWPEKMQEQRKKTLSLLRDYYNAGKFPRNYDHSERKPCFIDRDGSICAVGYLVEQTAGREMAEKINSLFQYATIYEMNLPELSEWAQGAGLSVRECAMIQPAYGGWDDDPSVSTRDVIASSLFSGTNGAISILNLKNMNNPEAGNTLPIVGLVTGAASIVYGVAVPASSYNFSMNGPTSTFTAMNIGIGAATMVISGYSLANRKPNRKTAIGVYGYPSTTGMTAGIGFVKRF